MNMDVLSVRDYRNNLAASFSRADQGESVLIRRKNNIYALVNVGKEDLMITPELQKRIDEARKELLDGETIHFADSQSASKWMDDL